MSAIPNRLFLIGYRGTGKTTVARLLAQQLGWRWLDLDQLFEAEAGCSISEFFAREGEPAFRERESSLLQTVADLENVVVATGGGVVIAPANRALLRKLGHVIWLKAEPDAIAARLAGDPRTQSQRPALTNLGVVAEVQKVLTQRAPWYSECAHQAVDTNHRSPEDVAKTIMNSLARVGA
jgi:shikimate kinase